MSDSKPPSLTRTAWRRGDSPDALITREWLVTNGLGGYAAGTLGGACTRRFHSLLVSAFPSPLGRVTYISHLTDTLSPLGDDAPVIRLSGDDDVNSPPTYPDLDWLAEIRMDTGLPIWRFEHEGVVLERRVLMPHRQNTTYLVYTLVRSPKRMRLTLRPEFQIRRHEGPVNEAPHLYPILIEGDRAEVRRGQYPPLRMHVRANDQRLVVVRGESQERRYLVEEQRGYDSRGPLYTPARYEIILSEGETASFCVSTDSWDRIVALTADEVASSEGERRRRLLAQAHPRAQSGLGAELVLAADQFIIKPQARAADTARAHAIGDDARTVIAGYHWFTDWGRDTMISLEGLTLVTGRHSEAGCILRTFSQYVRDGLLPNLFPEGGNEGLYHTVDATLWFFHAVDRYVRATGDRETLSFLLPILIDVIDHHVRGTKFGIAVDPNDGLLRQGAEGYQLTWMDAKVDGWVVTPRRGKAVEVNALFYNALRLLEAWVRDAHGDLAAQPYATLAERTRVSFNRRFWYEPGGYLYDVVDGENGDDASNRPNQVFAISLDHPVLDPDKWKSVLQVVREKLWTPVGLRSLAPDQPDYKPTYDGDLRARDAAYHQGTVWAWLIGPFVDAWRRAYPDDHESQQIFIRGFGPHMGEACVGSVSEIFDAEKPYTPRGCVAQAWSVAEVLRSIAKD